MKILMITGIMISGIFLTGCETTVVSRRHDSGDYRYHDDGHYGSGGAHYRSRNFGRTNVYETNVYETDVHRTDVTRTAARTRPQPARFTAGGHISPAVQTHAVTANVTKKIAKGHDKEKKHDGDEQSQH